MADDAEDQFFGGTEVRAHVAGPVPGVAADSWRCGLAGLEEVLSSAREVGAVDVGIVGAGGVCSPEVGQRAGWCNRSGGLNDFDGGLTGDRRPEAADVVLVDSIDLPSA